MRIPGLLTLFMTLACIHIAVAQSVQSLVPSVPTSPQAEAIKIHGNFSINMSSGTPDISVPLFDIDHRGFRLPVTLKYVATPFRPGYNFDVFGKGWGLSVSSCVSRSIEYLPDEWTNFVLDAPGSIPFDKYNQCGNVCFFEKNYAHDKFNVVLPDGSSFDFVIDNQNNNKVFIISDGRQLKMDCNVYNSQIEWFTVVDEQGIKYTFSGADAPRLGSDMPHAGTYVSWLLSRIDLPGSPDPVLFEYSELINPAATSCGEYVVSTLGSFIPQTVVPGETELKYRYDAQKTMTYSANAYQMRLLTTITFGPGGNNKVTLTYQSNSSLAMSSQAEKIELWEGATVVKRIELLTSMYGGNSLCYDFPYAALEEIKITGRNAGAVPLTYQCSYYSRFGGGVDHWGYINDGGQDMPNFNVFLDWHDNWLLPFSTSELVKDAADVNPFRKFKLSFPFSYNTDFRVASAPGSHAVLARLTYPTGGFTDFEFENHRFLTAMSGDGNYVHDPQNRGQKNAAGFRIRTVTNYTAQGVMAAKKNYRYGTLDESAAGITHTGLGEAVVDPNSVTYLGFALYSPYQPLDYSPRQMVIGVDQYDQVVSFDNPFKTGYMLGSKWIWECNFSAANFRRALGGRPPVVYAEVTEYDGEIELLDPAIPFGKTVYKYELAGEYPWESFYEPLQYFGNTLSYEPKPYLHSRLKEKTEYRYEAATGLFKAVRTELNTYVPATISYYDYEFGNTYVREQMMGPYYSEDGDHGNGTASGAFIARSQNFGKSLLYSKETRLFDPSGGSISSMEDYTYHSPVQLASVTSRTSDGKWVAKRFQYPGSGSDPVLTPPAVVADMISKNIIAPVLTMTTGKSTTGSAEFLIAGNQVEYGHVGSPSIIRPVKSHQLEFPASGPSYFLQNEIKEYSANGNPLEILEKNSNYNSYIWGHDDRYMTAMAINARAGDIAYTSFEVNNKGNWTYSGMPATVLPGNTTPTGTKYYSLASGALSKAVTNGKSYVISYWKNTSTNSPFSVSGGTGSAVMGATVNGWTYFEHKIAATASSVDISGSGNIDEVRLYPAGAQMTTYTYEPLIGITSQCDANNRIAYYEYDSFGRLLRIRDANSNILKQFDYQYQVPTHNNPIWQTTGQTRCKPCPANSTYITNVLQNEERDNNPNSPTYSQTRWTDAGTSGSCVITADWQNTATPVRCKQVSGTNTGEQEQEQRDMNPCSGTANQTRWVVTGTNTTACPLPPPTIYVRLTLTNPNGGFTDVVLDFFSDPDGINSVSVSNLTVNITEEIYNDLQGTSTYNNHSFNCNGMSEMIMTGVPLIESGSGGAILYRFLYLASGTGYEFAY